MKGEEISRMQTQYVLQSWSKQKNLKPVPIEKAEGIYLYDYDGKRYADMSSQQVNMNLGYGNEEISDAIKNKLDQYAYIGPSYGDISRAELGKMIIDLLPDTFGKVFFTNAGADANENAIKIARSIFKIQKLSWFLFWSRKSYRRTKKISAGTWNSGLR